MNKQINHNELRELFKNPSNFEENTNIPATNLAPEAINDNYFLVQYKNLLEKTSDEQAQKSIIN